MKAAVFVSAGLGDALLLVPLIKALKKQGSIVVGIFTSPFHCEQLFEHSGVFDETIVLPDAVNSFLSTVKNFRKFDVAYLNFFASTRKNMLVAKNIAKKIVVNNPEFSSWQKNNFLVVPPLKNIHDATQNLRLLHPEADDSFLNEESFNVNFLKLESALLEGTLENGQKYFTVQISAGNNAHPYKNWPVTHWMDFLKRSSEKFPLHSFILMGDSNEMESGNLIVQKNIPRVISLIGKTTIREAVEIIRNSEVFIGLDGGLMHIAAAAGKASFTLWGPSDFNLYGYQKICPRKHRIVYHSLPCRPCNSWIAPNTSRVMRPMDCPDFNCMTGLKPENVFEEFIKFFEDSTT